LVDLTWLADRRGDLAWRAEMHVLFHFTLEVHITTTRMTEEDVMPSGIVAVVSSRDARHPPPLGLIDTVDKYTEIR
jgi:hypothetical protein